MALKSLVLATRNAHKVEEIRDALGNDFQYLTLADFPGAPDISENGASFAENAALKSRGIADWLLRNFQAFAADGEFAVLADDSGLEVDALNGAPGIHSARFAAEEFGLKGNAPDAANNAKLLQLLAQTPPEQRRARFKCVLALTRADLSATFFQGACEGRIGYLPRGASGFGYDPLFIPDGFDRAFAELGAETKSRVSHRARALESLARFLLAARDVS
jgi:XTP/dITP diphosphohydrolase